MTTISFSGGRGNTPGTYVYEQTIGTSPTQPASFNTIYVPVEVDLSVNSIVFPFNTPVRISSYREYIALLGNTTPVDKWQNLSLQYIESLFKMAGTGDVRVIRLASPSKTTQIKVDPSANAVSPSGSHQLDIGDVVYVQLSINGFQLGESDSQGVYRGIPVTVPDSIPQAIASAIESDPEIKSVVYVRSISQDSLNIASRFSTELSVTPSSTPFEGGLVLSDNGLEITTSFFNGTLGFYDYTQSITTALDNNDLPQGYLVCPTGFSKFTKQERQALGELLESLVRGEDKKWVVLVDAGAFEISDIEAYSDMSEHEAADGFIQGTKYLINNHLIEWTGSNYNPNTAAYTPSNPGLSANSLPLNSRLSLKDNRLFHVDLVDGTTLTLLEEWILPSGTSVELEGVTYYVISYDVDSALGLKEIKLAESYSQALAGEPLEITFSGSAVLESSENSWDFPQTIQGETGSYIEGIKASGTYFNLHNLPGTLQSQTGAVYFKAVYRQISDPSTSGISNSSGDALFHVVSHGLSNRDRIVFCPGIDPIVEENKEYLVYRVSTNTFKLAASEFDYNNSIYVKRPSAPTTNTPVRFYSKVKVATSPGNFTYADKFSLLKGRKYQFDVTNAAVPLKDEEGIIIPDQKLEIRLTKSSNPQSGEGVLSGGIVTGDGFSIALYTEGDYIYRYLENSSAQPITSLVGSENYFCVPDNRSESGVKIALVCNTDGEITFLNNLIQVDYLDPNTPVPDSLWNVKVVTAFQLLDESLRSGDSFIIETGIDNHSRLLEDARLYNTQQGFLAYYGPRILSDNFVWVPATAWVAGLAIRRYRDEGGFQSPPAGTKYALLGARDVQIAISSSQQEISNPYGLNAVRRLPGYGDQIFVWGGRTRVDTSKTDQRLYQFINTRVIMNVLYGTLRTAFDNKIFSVSEGPGVLFNEVRSIANSIMYDFYTRGYLFGDTPSDAYQVVVDSRNNPAQNLENGVVNIQIFAVPATVTERIEIDLFRVAVGNISLVTSEQ